MSISSAVAKVDGSVAKIHSFGRPLAPNEKGIGSKRDTKRMFVGSAVAKIDGSVVKSIVVDESVFQPNFGF